MNRQRIPETFLVAGALAMTFPVLAQDDFFFDDEDFEAEEELVEALNYVEVGVIHVSQDSKHFGRHSGLDSKGFSPVLDLRAQGRPEWDGGSTAFWRLEGYRLGWDSGRLEVKGGWQGRQTFGLSWREMPNWQYAGGLTPYQSGSDGVFTLPPGWQASGNNTAGLSTLRDQLYPVDIGTDRQRLDLNYWRSALDRWTFDVNYRHETKEGSRLAGGIFGFTGGNPRSVHLPAPVDQTTRIIDTKLEYAAERWLMGVAYHGSFFENDHPSFGWQNAFGQHPQWQPGTGFPDGSGRLSAPPDNEFHQFRVYGGLHFANRTQFNVDLATGRMRQNEHLMAYTINPNTVIEAGLPIDRLDGEIRTTLLNLRLSTQAVDRLNLVFNYRFDDRDNQSPMLAWRIAGADSQPQVTPGNARINLPYSYRQQELKADASYRLARRNRLVGGIAFTREDRDNFAEVAELDELRLWAGWRGALGQRVGFRIDVEHADRQYDEYEGRNPFVAGHVPGYAGPEDFENHPNLRKYNIADRQRNQLRTRMDFQAAETLSLGVGYHYSKDDYDDQRFGLTDARVQSLHADIGFYPSEHLSFSGYYSHDRYQAGQAGRDWPGNQPQLAFDPARNWFADHKDRIDTASLSMEFVDLSRRFEALSRAGLNRKLDLGAELLFMRTRGQIDVSTGAGLNAQPFPDTVNRLNATRLWLRYQISTQWYTRLSIEHSRYDSSNFALDNADLDTLGNVLLLGFEPPSYSVTAVMLGVGFRY